MERRFLSIKELSVYLGVTVGTLYSWVCYRKIPYIKMGRLTKFDLREIEEWVKKRRVVEYRGNG